MTSVEIIARALGGASSQGHGTWIARCPAHNDKNPSLSLKYDASSQHLSVRCWAGCDKREIYAALFRLGLFDNNKPYARPMYRVAPCYKMNIEKASDATKYAQVIWNDTHPINSTLGEKYLRIRGYSKAKIPYTLRYHPNLPHRPSGKVFPAIVAAVNIAPDNEMVGIHRTYLLPDGSDKADVIPSKMCLGKVGGGAVRLSGRVRRKLIVTEGIETALSVLQATGISTFAALSATGLKRLILPHHDIVREVIIAADHDANGCGQRAAESAATRWSAEGYKVSIALPQQEGFDFNDLLRKQ